MPQRPVLLSGIALAATLALVPAAPATAQQLTGFRSVLAQGQGGTATAADLSANLATGAVPRVFVNQQDLYTGIATKYPTLTAADLDRYFKDADPGAMPGGEASREEPRPGVVIVRDKQFNIPRITAPSRAEVMWGSGYAQAQDRLFLMDVLRRTARGSLSELLGPSAAEGDAKTLTQQDFSGEELDAQLAALSDRHGVEGQRVEEDMAAFVAGINAWIDKVKADPELQPAEYAALGAEIAPWTTADSSASATLLVSEFNVAGLGERVGAVILEALRRRLKHPVSAQRALDDLRRLDDPEAPVTATNKTFPYEDITRQVDPRAVAIPDKDSMKPRNALVGTAPAPGTPPPFAQSILGLRERMPTTKSNALLVSAKHSKSGRPLAAMGPQVGYYSPQIFSEVELRGGGVDVAGVVFPGAAPYVLIGRTPRFAWSGTSPMSDLGDVWAERLCDPAGKPVEDPEKATHYLHYRRCVPFHSREQVLTTPANPTKPGSTSETIRLKTLRSVHGPVTHFGRVAGDPVAFTQQKTVDFRELDAALAFARIAIGEVTDAKSFDHVWRDYPGAENWYFISDKETSFVLSGVHPRRARGVDPGLPAWGTGEWDWQKFNPIKHTFRELPYRRNPRSIDPPRGYIVNWNNKEARRWRSGSDTWTLAGTHRSRLLERRLRAERKRKGFKLELDDVVRVAQGAHMGDLEIQELLPWFERVMRGRTDAESRALLAILDRWRANGGEHRDLDGNGLYEDGAAIALMRAWVPLVARRVFEPRLGSEVVDLLDETGLIDLTPGRSEFGGWHGHLQKDLRTILERKVRGKLSRRYCGGGSKARCARILVATLKDAGALLRKEFNGGPETWRTPVQMQSIVTAGAIKTPSFPLQNRATFHQVIELRPR